MPVGGGPLDLAADDKFRDGQYEDVSFIMMISNVNVNNHSMNVTVNINSSISIISSISFTSTSTILELISSIEVPRCCISQLWRSKNE